MDNFTASLVLLLLLCFAAGVIHSISPVGAGIAAFVIIAAFLKELIWGNKN